MKYKVLSFLELFIIIATQSISMDVPSEKNPQSTTHDQNLIILKPNDFTSEDKGRYLPVAIVIKQLADPIRFSIELIMENASKRSSIHCDYSWNKIFRRDYILDRPISHVYLKISEKLKQKIRNVFFEKNYYDFNFKDGDDFFFFQHDSQLSPEWIASPKHNIPQIGTIDLQIWTLSIYNPYNNMAHRIGFPDSKAPFIKLSGNRDASSLHIYGCISDKFQEIFKNFLYVNYYFYLKSNNSSSKKKLEIVYVLPHEVRFLIINFYVHLLLKSSLQYI